MILSSPPPGGATWMSRSTPAGGQITPLDCASLSLSGASLPLPTVGPSPLTSGGHATPCSGTRSAPTDCASAAPGARPTNIAKIRLIVRKGLSSQTYARSTRRAPETFPLRGCGKPDESGELSCLRGACRACPADDMPASVRRGRAGVATACLIRASRDPAARFRMRCRPCPQRLQIRRAPACIFRQTGRGSDD
jgi:hypothetical protein